MPKVDAENRSNRSLTRGAISDNLASAFEHPAPIRERAPSTQRSSQALPSSVCPAKAGLRLLGKSTVRTQLPARPVPHCSVRLIRRPTLTRPGNHRGQTKHRLSRHELVGTTDRNEAAATPKSAASSMSAKVGLFFPSTSAAHPHCDWYSAPNRVQSVSAARLATSISDAGKRL